MSKLKPTRILCSAKSVSSMKICNCILQLSKARLGRSHSSEQTSNTVDAVVARPSRHSCCSSNCCSHFLGLIGCVHTHTNVGSWGHGVNRFQDSNSSERCSKFSCGFHTRIQTLRQSLRFAYVSQVFAYDRYVSMSLRRPYGKRLQAR